MKKYRINFLRTITIEGSIVLNAGHAERAAEKAQAMFDDGKFGVVKWRIKDGDPRVVDAEIASEEDKIEFEYPEEEEE